MKYATLFFLTGLCWLALAVLNGGWFRVFVWPGLTNLYVAFAYATRNPALLGKRSGGGIRPVAVALLLPYFAATWTLWHFLRLLTRGEAGHEVAPGVYVGRRPYAGEIPPDTRLVIDVTGEFVPARGVRTAEGRSYFCVPTLDGSAPPESALADVLQQIAACGNGGGGTVYIHCAQGRGRSAAVAAAVLIARGVAADVEEAEWLIAKARPVVKLNAAQRAWVERVTAGDLHPPATVPAGS
jgi:protein-tyrosine phosphatase